MSLDVSLVADKPIEKTGTGVFIRRDGKNVELTLGEVRERWPEAEVEESKYDSEYFYSANITHNLGKMADAAGIYEALWRPEEKGWTHAKDIVGVLQEGLKQLKEKPAHFEQFNSENGWGIYEHFVPFVEDYLAACREYPDAKIEVSR